MTDVIDRETETNSAQRVSAMRGSKSWSSRLGPKGCS